MIAALNGQARPGEMPSPDLSDQRDQAMTAHRLGPTLLAANDNVTDRSQRHG
jgi:hypothetical protein